MYLKVSKSCKENRNYFKKNVLQLDGMRNSESNWMLRLQLEIFQLLLFTHSMKLCYNLVYKQYLSKL